MDYPLRKYNFHIEREKSALPEDINVIVEDIALNYANPRLKTEMERIRKFKLFGELEYWLPDFKYKLAEFEYADGICKKYRLIMVDGKPFKSVWKDNGCHVIFKQEKLNTVIDIRKPKGENDG